MHTFFQNVRFALRQWRESPGFVAMAVLTLALGIGGTTAIFTLVDVVMFRSLPVADPGRLYRVGDGTAGGIDAGPQERWGLFSFSLYERLKTEMAEFEEVAAFQQNPGYKGVRREGVELAPRLLRMEYVTGNYFSTLGLSAFGGRLFTPNDDRAQAAPVVALSHHAWQSLYGADPGVVGSTFVIEGHPFTVVGVAPPGFFGETLRPNPPDVWVPVEQELTMEGESALLHERGTAWLCIVGRLRPGASIAGMGPRLSATVRQWVQHDAGYPPSIMPDVIRMLPRMVIHVVPAGAGVGEMTEEVRRNLRILFSICGLVLLIACANVANLLLAHAASRRGQTVLRLAVGAPRQQVVAQAITESVLLAIAGAIAGLGVAAGCTRLMLFLLSGTGRFIPVSATPSLHVLAFAFVLALLAGVISGTAPAWLATRTDPAQALRGAGHGSGYRSSFAGKSLLVVQATLSVVLVAGAAMLVRSLHKLESQDLGYPTAGRVVVALSPPPGSYTLPRLTALYGQIEDRLNRLPGVQGTGLALYNPLSGGWSGLVYVAGHPVPKVSPEALAAWDRVSAGYLQNLGVPVVRGRLFTPGDNETAEPVAVVNEAFVEHFFKKGEDPLDRHFGLSSPAKYRIVGIVSDPKFVPWSLRGQAPPMVFAPLAQTMEIQDEMLKKQEVRSHFIGGIMLATAMSPASLEPLLRKALAEVDPNLTVIYVLSMQQMVELSFEQDHTVATMASLFGAVALLLAAVGLYAVTSYTVAQRTSEIGVRMALGASRTEVLQFVLRGAFRRVVVGLALGLLLAVVAGHLIKAGLYGVTGWDPLALTVATSALAFSAFLAVIVPAGRAAAIEPMDALRAE
jgi:predicted permease